MVSPEAQAEIDRMREAKGPSVPLQQARRDWESAALADVLPAGTVFAAADVGGVPCEWVDVPGVLPDRLFLFLHGGGYNAGSPRTHRKLAAHLGASMQARVLTPDYRLAPEHPFPAGLDDVLAVYRALIRQGTRADQIVVGGDSAGGGLALSLLLSLRQRGIAQPRAAILLSPWTDLTLSSPSYEQLRTIDPATVREELAQAATWYAGERDAADPMLSPMFADLSALPPMLIHVGGNEIMRDDSRLFAERAAAAGVDVSLKVSPGLWHVFHFASPAVPEARQAIDEIGAYVRTQYPESP